MRTKMKKIEINDRLLTRADIEALTEEYNVIKNSLPQCAHYTFLNQCNVSFSCYYLIDDDSTITIDPKNGQWILLDGYWPPALIHAVIQCNNAISNYNESRLNYSRKFWLEKIISIMENYKESL